MCDQFLSDQDFHMIKFGWGIHFASIPIHDISNLMDRQTEGAIWCISLISPKDHDAPLQRVYKETHKSTSFSLKWWRTFQFLNQFQKTN